MDYSLPEIKINTKFLAKLIQSNILLYFVAILLVLKIASIFVFVNFSQNIFFADITRITLENFANQTRQSIGLEPLVESQKLKQAAQMKAENMVQNNYFAHISPAGISPWHWFLQAGYNYKYAGENLAIGFFDSKEVYDAWLNSPSHKENIINPNYKEVGTAVLAGFGQNNAIVVVQEFGSQLSAKTSAKPPVEPEKISEPVLTDTNEKVLSQTIEPQNFVEASTNSFVLYDYNDILQKVIYGVSLIIIGALLILIFLNPTHTLGKRLVFRSVLIVILLTLATAVNKELLVLSTPHQIIIQ